MSRPSSESDGAGRRDAAWADAVRLEASGNFAGACARLDAALDEEADAPSGWRFRALLLRAELAVTLDEPGEGRGILAEALRVQLTVGERASLEAELRRADDLEAFLTHRGCAG